MTERPILFSGPLVRAILDGRKVQTRRPVSTGRFPPEHWNLTPTSDGRGLMRTMRDGIVFGTKSGGLARSMQDAVLRCPFGVPGDRLWVRERARLIEVEGGLTWASGVRDVRVRLRYEADGAESDWVLYPNRLAGLEVGRCIPNGVHREGARLRLEVVDLRVERLQEIDDAGVMAEGWLEINRWLLDTERRSDAWARYTKRMDPKATTSTRRAGFAVLWDAAYREALRWKANPWVWVTTFRRLP